MRLNVTKSIRVKVCFKLGFTSLNGVCTSNKEGQAIPEKVEGGRSGKGVVTPISQPIWPIWGY